MADISNLPLCVNTYLIRAALGDKDLDLEPRTRAKLTRMWCRCRRARRHERADARRRGHISSPAPCCAPSPSASLPLGVSFYSPFFPWAIFPILKMVSNGNVIYCPKQIKKKEIAP